MSKISKAFQEDLKKERFKNSLPGYVLIGVLLLFTALEIWAKCSK